jgi:Trp operon repressor
MKTMSRKSNAEKENALLIEQLKKANSEIHELKLGKHLQMCLRVDDRTTLRNAHNIIGELFSTLVQERMKKELALLGNDYGVTVTLESKEAFIDGIDIDDEQTNQD